MKEERRLTREEGGDGGADIPWLAVRGDKAWAVETAAAAATAATANQALLRNPSLIRPTTEMRDHQEAHAIIYYNEL